jgi:hypothetical protein
MAKSVDHYQEALSYAARVFSKTASALPATSENTFIRGKVISSIDYDKVSCIDQMYKHSNISALSIMGPTALKALAASGVIAGVGAIAAPAIARSTARAAVEGGSDASKEKATEIKNYALGVGIPATLVAALGAAKAGIFGEKAEDYADNVTNKVINLFGKKEDSKSEYLNDIDLDSVGLGSPEYKVAAAKTYHRLKTAEKMVKSTADREKLSFASNECAKILFDSVFYL